MPALLSDELARTEWSNGHAWEGPIRGPGLRRVAQGCFLLDTSPKALPPYWRTTSKRSGTGFDATRVTLLWYVVRAVAQQARQRLLRQAAELMGREELAIRLKVPAPLLDAWMRGLAAMSDRKLVLLADALEDFATEKKK